MVKVITGVVAPKKPGAKSEVGQKGTNTQSVKKTVVLDSLADRYLKAMAGLEGLSDTEFIRLIIEKSITEDVRKMVDMKISEEQNSGEK